MLTIRATDRITLHPQGADGGGEGRGGGFVLNPDTQGMRDLPSKATNLPVNAGDVLRMSVPGGGGFGNPLERDPAKVAQDVRYGIVSRECARSDYGVVVDATGQADAGETAKLRTQLCGAAE